MLLERIMTADGEIAVYQDADGYHAERWSDRSQAVVAQSGDRETREEAVEDVQ